MLVGEIEALDWAEVPGMPRQVRIRHCSADGQVFEVGVAADSIDLSTMAHPREARDGRILVRIVPGRYVAGLDHAVLMVRRHDAPPRAAHKRDQAGRAGNHRVMKK